MVIINLYNDKVGCLDNKEINTSPDVINAYENIGDLANIKEIIYFYFMITILEHDNINNANDDRNKNDEYKEDIIYNNNENTFHNKYLLFT